MIDSQIIAAFCERKLVPEPKNHADWEELFCCLSRLRISDALNILPIVMVEMMRSDSTEHFYLDMPIYALRPSAENDHLIYGMTVGEIQCVAKWLKVMMDSALKDVCGKEMEEALSFFESHLACMKIQGKSNMKVPE